MYFAAKIFPPQLRLNRATGADTIQILTNHRESGWQREGFQGQKDFRAGLPPYLGENLAITLDSGGADQITWRSDPADQRRRKIGEGGGIP